MSKFFNFFINFTKKHRILLSAICALSFLFASNIAITHEHKDDKIHDDCPICIFKISNNIESAGKSLPKIPKVELPKPIYNKPNFILVIIPIREKSRYPPVL